MEIFIMKSMRNTSRAAVSLLFSLFFTLMYTSCSTVPNNNISDNASIIVTNITPVDFSTDALHQGLKATYYLDFFKRDLTYLKKMKPGEFKSFAGPPITHLNHQFEKGNVFASGTNRGVAIQMEGFLYFPATGTYSLQALSNDGVILYLEDQLTISDPKQHGDRLSDIANVEIKKTGWIPIKIAYFQRKGTAALTLFWITPRTKKFTPVPAKSYGHIQ